jgi:hypothetical protein
VLIIWLIAWSMKTLINSGMALRRLVTAKLINLFLMWEELWEMVILLNYGRINTLTYSILSMT